VRGYFGIGVEGISKAFNVGNLFRTAHAFGASFVFTVDAHFRAREAKSDTSRALGHVPFYDWPSIDDIALPRGCQLVAVELVDNAVALPSFRHPQNAAYVLGRERGNVSDALMSRASHAIQIPTKFCLNVGIAGAIVMYDRLVNLGHFPDRPVMPGGPGHPSLHVHGDEVLNEQMRTAPHGSLQSPQGRK
jgi:tRNA G18 (ribose-2'-O)-methylase SpoU